MNDYRRSFLLTAAAGALATMSVSAFAQSSDRTMRIVVPMPPGGTTDIVGRMMSRELGEALGIPAIVDNRAGASGIIGAGLVAKAPPDGFTLLLASSSYATAPYLYKTMPYDTDRDLVPVSLVAMSPYVLVVHPSVPANNFAELIALLKKHPNEYTFASSSPGTIQHLAGELLQRTAGVQILHVPYKGSGELLPDVLAGRVPMLFENVAVMTPYIRRGQMRAIAVTSAERVPMLPDVPTVMECGLPNFELLGAFSLWAPRGLPPEMITRLNAEVNKIIAKPAVIKRFEELGADPLAGSPAKLTAWLKSDQAKFGPLIKDIGIEGK